MTRRPASLLDFARVAFIHGQVPTPSAAARLVGLPVATVLEIAQREAWAARRAELADVIDLAAVRARRKAR